MSHAPTCRSLAPALFLAVDGALLERSPSPTTVSIPGQLTELLYQLWLRLDGAMALVSGRHIDDLDRMFRPYRFPAIGLHGSEYRDGSDNVVTAKVDSCLISQLHENASLLASQFSDVLIEYRSHGVAFHYGLDPLVAPRLLRDASRLCRQLGIEFALYQGEVSIEVLPAIGRQDMAIRALMNDRLFRNRQPILIGADLVDETGFGSVNAIGGVSIGIGPTRSTCAQHWISGREDLLQLLFRISNDVPTPIEEFSRAFQFSTQRRPK